MIALVKENIKIALSSIRTQILRTTLTVLIIAIGIMALVGILTVVSALSNTITKDFASMGANTFSISQYKDDIKRHKKGKQREKINPIITYSQAQTFKEKYKFPLTYTSISFIATPTAEIKYENKKTDPEVSVLGVDENYITNTGFEIVKGRNFSGFDIINNHPVCLLGADFEKKLLANMNPLDKTISIRGAKFKVIGILKEKGSSFGNNQDLRVLIPLPVARSLFSSPNINYTTSVMTTRKDFLEVAIENAILKMRIIRKLKPIEDDNFGITRSDDLIRRIIEITSYLDISAWIIGIITLFGSSIALMNIMLVSVTERTREIGTRKALGAKRSTIAFQFFMETLIIGQLGGILGTLSGILIGYGFATLLEFDFVIPWIAIISAFIICFIVAIISGSYPALKASKLDPIEALRYE
ncbi:MULTISPECIES: ABC transporter permease [Flavobacterium]|uniref:FtsX-like permease family protein n=2 Tax=Flavobacterium TaxID=237 RepID=A0A2N9P9L3_9FLAO|nr:MULTISPECIES: ABC transporter permease [Flavobacterium]QYS88479.1 ABC transporter permease [Flavobacterium davisii]RVU89577.1 FtsX-like permease family protein [Flavobacterium columnare]SPE77026.1 Macrolide export ATP-binding/permease protein MacB [Flavobacterium columnare]